MKKTLLLTAFLIALIWGSPQTWGAGTRTDDEQPIITIKSDAYKVAGADNSFGIMLGATENDIFNIDTGFGRQKMEVGAWSVENGTIVGTYKSLNISQVGEIKIYGDPAKIDMLQIQGGYVTEIDMPDCRNIEVLDLSHNTCLFYPSAAAAAL